MFCSVCGSLGAAPQLGRPTGGPGRPTHTIEPGTLFLQKPVLRSAEGQRAPEGQAPKTNKGLCQWQGEGLLACIPKQLCIGAGCSLCSIGRCPVPSVVGAFLAQACPVQYGTVSIL